MVMFFLIPVEKNLAECPGILNRAEPVRELRAILQGLELCLGIWIIVAYMRSAMDFGYAQISQQMCNSL